MTDYYTPMPGQKLPYEKYEMLRSLFPTAEDHKRSQAFEQFLAGTHDYAGLGSIFPEPDEEYQKLKRLEELFIKHPAAA